MAIQGPYIGGMTHMMNVVDCCLSCPTFSEGQNAFLRPLCIGLDANKDGRLSGISAPQFCGTVHSCVPKVIEKKNVTAASRDVIPVMYSLRFFVFYTNLNMT